MSAASCSGTPSVSTAAAPTPCAAAGGSEGRAKLLRHLGVKLRLTARRICSQQIKDRPAAAAAAALAATAAHWQFIRCLPP